MKSRMLPLAVLGAFSFAAGGALAQPVSLTNAQMDTVTAGALDLVRITHSGHIVDNGQALGLPQTYVNPQGKPVGKPTP